MSQPHNILLLALVLCLSFSTSTPVLAAAGNEPEVARVAAEAADGSWLGVWLVDAVDGGLEVVALVPGGPAQASGLRIGDVIVRADRVVVNRRDELQKLLDRHQPGQSLGLALLRSGELLDAQVELGRRVQTFDTVTLAPASPIEFPQSPPRPDPIQWAGSPAPFGVRVEPITGALRSHYGAPEDAGVLVTRVTEKTAAAEAGVAVGDVLVRVGDRSIVDGRGLETEFRQWNRKSPLTIRVVRRGKPLALTASVPARTLGETPRALAGDPDRVLRRLQDEKLRLERRLEEIDKALRRLESKR